MENIEKLDNAINALKNDEVICFPTDTVYGLGANAFSYKAIDKIYEIKNRDYSKPLIVMVNKNYDLLNIVEHISEDAKILIKHFWPGCLTIIFKSKKYLPQNAFGNLDTIGVRIPNNEKALSILNMCNFPLVTTSANESGMPSPINFEQAKNYMNDKVKILIDDGDCKEQVASTIIDCSSSNLKILRIGSISKEEIEKVLNKKIN